MRSNKWIWAACIALVLVIGGAAFALGRMSSQGEGNQQPSVQALPPSEEEKELQKIKIAASEGELKEVRRLPEGWVVRVEQKAGELIERALGEQAQKFFRDLDRTQVDVALVSFVARTDALTDVWGNTLKDVVALRIELAKETFDKINWQGFKPENFPRVADLYWLHDAVTTIGEEKQMTGQAGMGTQQAQQGGSAQQNQQGGRGGGM